MARKTLTDNGVKALKPRPRRYAHPDPELSGHFIRVTPTGAKTFCAVTRAPTGRQIWTTIGSAEVMTVMEAREQAREVIKRVRAGLPAIPAKTETFGEVLANWQKRHVEAKGLRSHREIDGLLRRHIPPEWRDREIASIRRSDVTALLDEVEDDHGARQADYVLALIRGAMNWHAARHDDYHPPIVRGMRRTDPKSRTRARILDDDELRAIWTAAETAGTFGAIVRLLLLTAQRRQKVMAMRWQDLSLDGEWNIPKEPREKDNAGTLVLPEAAIAIIRAQPRLGDNPYVFAGRGDGYVSGGGKSKAQFDSKLPLMKAWVLHDLRRSARSLLSRASVSSDHAERVMGHAITGVEGVYDRYAYKAEKADALERLAALIDGIVHPRANVVALPKRKRAR